MTSKKKHTPAVRQKELVVEKAVVPVSKPEVAEETGLTPQARHEKWVTQKILAGWVYGSILLSDVREHPCIVPYSALSEAQRKMIDLHIEELKELV